MEEEVARGRELDEQGVIREASRSPDVTRAFMLIEAEDEDEEAARRVLASYSQVRAGLPAFTSVEPLLGLPAIARVHEERGEHLPAWWPS